MKMTLDANGNIFVLGVSANANTNTGYVAVKYAPNGKLIWSARYDSTNYPSAAPTGFSVRQYRSSGAARATTSR